VAMRMHASQIIVYVAMRMHASKIIVYVAMRMMPTPRLTPSNREYYPPDRRLYRGITYPPG
jgi:hypothetical protein